MIYFQGENEQDENNKKMERDLNGHRYLLTVLSRGGPKSNRPHD